MSRSKVFIAQRQSQKKSNFVKFSSFDQHSLELILFTGKETAKLSLQIGESANTNKIQIQIQIEEIAKLSLQILFVVQGQYLIIKGIAVKQVMVVLLLCLFCSVEIAMFMMFGANKI